MGTNSTLTREAVENDQWRNAAAALADGRRCRFGVAYRTETVRRRVLSGPTVLTFIIGPISMTLVLSR